MIKTSLSLGALLIAFFEAIGFETVRQYLRVLDIPLHLAAVPLFELTSWAIPVFFSADALPLYALVGGLLAIEYIRFLGSATSAGAQTIVHYPSGNEVSPLTYLLSHAFGQDTSYLAAFARLMQVVMLVFIVVGFFGRAETTGTRMAEAALTGRVYGTVAQADVREAVHLEPKKDAPLSRGIGSANARGALVQLWADEKILYVAPIHAGNAWERGRTTIFAVDRDTVAGVKYSRQWQQVKPVARVRSSPDWTWLAVVFACLAFAFVVVIGYLQQRRQIAAVTPATGEELRELPMPIGEAQSIVRAVQGGHDVYLTVREPDGTRRIWLRSASIEHGLVVKESAPPSIMALLRGIASWFRGRARRQQRTDHNTR